MQLFAGSNECMGVCANRTIVTLARESSHDLNWVATSKHVSLVCLRRVSSITRI